MLKIGKLPDYGIVVSTLFVDAGQLLTTQDVIEQSQLPQASVRKLLKLLVDGGLLVSYRGNQGGYELARPPEQISVAEVIQAIDGPISLTGCDRENNRCQIKESCGLGEKWSLISNAITDQLESVSLVDMAKERR